MSQMEHVAANWPEKRDLGIIREKSLKLQLSENCTRKGKHDVGFILGPQQKSKEIVVLLQ